MNVKNEISLELQSLSTLVDSISRQTPYEVPDGYFNSFPALVLQKAAKPLTFSVPDGYFEGFAQSVLNRIKTGTAQDDLLPAIFAQISRKTPYSIPEGYFDELSPVLTLLRKNNPYSLPVGYFDSLASEIQAKTAAVQPAAVQPAADQPAARPAKVSAKAGAKVFSLASHRLWKYSAAAVVTGLVVAIGWLRLHTGGTGSHDKTTPVNIEQTIAKVSDEDLQSFLANQDTTLAQPVALNNNAAVALEMSDNDLNTMLGDVPDGDLKQYMEEHGGANTIATN